MADTSWERLAWLLKKDDHVIGLCEEISLWDGSMTSQDLSTANGAVIILAANSIAENYSEDSSNVVSHVKKAIRNILLCLVNNTSKENRCILFKVVEGFHSNKGFLSSEDKDLCMKLTEEAYGSGVVEESSVEPAPQSSVVSGAKKLFENLSLSVSKSTTDETTSSSVGSLLDQEFWLEEDLAQKLISACVDSEGFEPLLSKECTELPNVFIPTGSTEKAFNASNISVKLVSLHQSVECALVLFNLRSVWSPSDDNSMKQLEKLVILSSDSAVACAYTATYLNRMRMAQGGSGGEPGGAPSEDKTPPVSFVELLQMLSCCVRRVAPTLPNMISIAVSVIKTALKACDNSKEELVPQQDILPDNILKNIRLLILHHLFDGLSAAVCRPDLQSELPWHVRFSVYMLDMLNTFCDLLSGLLEDVVKEGEQGSVTVVPWKDFTLQGHYQSKARLHTLDLFSNVYLLEMLLSIAESACKKMLSPPASSTATSLTTEASGTQGPPEVSRKTKPPPVPTIRGKYPGSTSPNVMVQQILQSAVAGLPSVPPLQPAGEEDKDEESQYESIDLHSPVQSIPSSEEGEGVYVLFNEEESVLEEVDEFPYPFSDSPLFDVNRIRPLPPLTADKSPPPPSAPPLPPLPPKRKSRPLPALPSEVKPPTPNDLPIKRMPFLKLAMTALECIHKNFIATKNPIMRDFLKSRFSSDKMECLGRLLHCIYLDKNLALIKDLSELSTLKELTCNVINDLILTGIFANRKLEDTLLFELELRDVGGDWPLHIPTPILSILARLLIWRLGNLDSGNDPLCIDIWNRFLHTLETTVTQGGNLTSKQDISVPHFQLLALIFHHFTMEAKTSILHRSITAVIRVAQAMRSGVDISPLLVARLLMALDYLVFQFNGEGSQHFDHLTEQVQFNLLSAQHSGPSDVVRCYPGTIEGDYVRVLLKIVQQNNNDCIDAIKPRFYNLRPVKMQVVEEVSEDEDGSEAEVCHSVMLDYKGPGGETYVTFHESLVFLFGSVLKSPVKECTVFNKVLNATAARQCSSICYSLLTVLPPSATFLEQFFRDDGFVVESPEGVASVLLMVRFLSLLRAQVLDSTDLLEALENGGIKSENAEELVGRIMSLTSSNEFFIPQALECINKALNLPEDSLPCEITFILLDLLVSLIEQEVAPLVTTPKEVPLKRRKGRRKKKGEKADSSKEPKEEGIEATDSVEPKGGKRPIKRKPTPADTSEKIPDFVNEAAPIICNLIVKMMKFVHLFVIKGEHITDGGFTDPLRQQGEEFENVYELMLRVGQMPTGKRDLFKDQLPCHVQERLTVWNDSLEVSVAEEGDNKNLEPGSLLSRILNKHCIAFAGYRPFSCVRSMKTVVMSSTQVMRDLCTVCDVDIVERVYHSLIPVQCSKAAEKLNIVDSSLDMSSAESPHAQINTESVKLMLSTTYELVGHPSLKDTALLGGVVQDTIDIVSHLIDDQSVWPVLVLLPSGSYQTDILSLILSTASDSVPYEVVLDGLHLFLKVVQLPEKNVDPHALLLHQQLSGLATQPPELVKKWLRRVVISQSTGDDELDCDGLTILSVIASGLAQEESSADSDSIRCILHHLLSIGPVLLDIVKEKKCYQAFKLFWTTCVSLVSSEVVEEHCTLLKAAAQWLPICTEIMSNDPTDIDNAPSPALVILDYLLLVSSALYYAIDQESCVSHHSLVADKELTLTETEGEMGDDGYPVDEDGECSDEEGLNEKLCTFTVTQKTFRTQYWYHCYTCGLAENTGVCSVCAKVCHKDHELAFSKHGSFFCDCGARGEAHCKALTPRAPDPSAKKRKLKQTKKTDVAKEVKPTQNIQEERKTKVPVIPVAVMKLSQQIEGSKEELKRFFESSNIAAQALDLLHQLNPAILKESNELRTGSGLALAQKALHDLHYTDKKVEHVESLMAAILGSPEGAFDNVKLNFSGDQGQIIKQLISSFAIHRVAMCCVSGGHGRKQHLAVSHDKGKLAILQLSALLKQSDSNKRKLTLTRLSSVPIPFTILSLAANPSYGSYLAVCGLKECVVLCFNSTGQAVERLALHPSVDFNSYLVKVVWVPGSRTELAVVADNFVKIYNLSVDTYSPQYYFVVMSGKVKDVTFAVNQQGKYLLVMMSSGVLYSQPIVPECSANDGPVYLVNEIEVSHEQVDSTDGIVCSGGASAYYSHSLQLLLFSYMNGKTFASHLNKDATKLEKLFYIPLKGVAASNNTSGGGGESSDGGSGTAKPPGSALVQWTEVPHFPGMVCSLSQSTSTPVVMFFKPDVILVHELRALSSKSKVQGIVAMHQVQGDGSAESEKTTLVLLSEDGSLRIYLASNNADTKYWVQPQFQASSPLAALRPRKKPIKEGPKGEVVKFPIDFFEHCVALATGSEVEFGGSDLLHIYNTNQVKTRLNTNGMYICNTRQSGFTVEVTNNQWKIMVMVGVRVLLGNKPPDRIPSYIEVFGRRVQCTMMGNTPRWFDVPFTREESLQAEKTFKLHFGPSKDGSGISFVDNIRVYAKGKGAFGWPEGQTDQPTTQNNTQQSGEVSPLEESSDSSALPVNFKSITGLDRMVCSSLSLLANCCSCIEVPQEVKSPCFDLSCNLLRISLPPSVQYHCKYLMSSVVKEREDFHKHADTALLSYVVKALFTVPPDPELFQRLLLSLLAVSKNHPLNLLQLLDPEKLKAFCEEDKGEEKQENDDTEKKESAEPKEQEQQDFISKLNSVFWLLIAQTPSTPLITSVATPALLGVDLVVMTLVEVMWAFVESGQVNISVIMPHVVKMLQSQVSRVSSTCMRTLIFLVQPKSKKPDLTDKDHQQQQPSPSKGDEEMKETEEEGPPAQEDEPQEDEQVEEEVQEVEEEPEEHQQQEGGGNQDPWDALLTVLPQQWHQAFNLLRMEFGTPADAMEHILATPEQFMAAMEGVVPGFDDDALMNVALALSSQESQGQASSNQQQQQQQQPQQQQQQQEEQNEEEPEAEDERNLESSGSMESLSGGELVVQAQEDNVVQVENVARQQVHSRTSSQGTLTPPAAQDGDHEQPSSAGKKKEEDGSSGGGDSTGDEDQGDEEDDLDHTLTESSPSQDQPTSEHNVPPGSEEDKISPDKLARLSLLRELVNVLPDLSESGGVGVIPLMQIVLSLCNQLDLTTSDKRVFADIIRKCFEVIDFNFEDVESLIGRSPQNEVKLVVLRFLGILLGYRKKDKHKEVKPPDVPNSRLLSGLTARLLLRETNTINFCLKLLKALLANQSNMVTLEETAQSSSTLKVPPPLLSTDLAPFFQRDYVKANSDDVFKVFPRMLTDMALNLPTELRKIGDSSKKMTNQLKFSQEWVDTLCEFLVSSGPLANVAKKPLKKLLVSICGSKEEYRCVRDLHFFAKKTEDIRSICFPSSLSSSATPLLLPHSTLLTLIEELKSVCDTAVARPLNWQTFCKDNDDVLPLLARCSLVLDEGLAPSILKLLYLAVTGHPLKVNDKGVPDLEAKRKAPETTHQRRRSWSGTSKQLRDDQPVDQSYLCAKLSNHFMSFLCGQELLENFIVLFLLQSNSTATRWQAHALVYGIYHCCQLEHKIHLVDTLWKLWTQVPTFGQRSSQFVDILGYVTISSGDLFAHKPGMKQTVVKEAIAQLHRQNQLLTQHPNAHIYSQLASLVNFDGYYLESEPCFICNNPEVPSCTTKLMSVKSEVRYSPNMIFVKLKNSYSISQFNILISDIKRSKMVHVVNLYYSVRTVQSAIELKNKKSFWVKAQSATLTQGQNEVKFEFPLPIVASNIIVEFAEFYTNVQASPEVLNCPRCGASVPAHPGVCGQCGENVFQCHKCRAINYDEKDPFLCNSCGVSKYAKFEYSMISKECTSVDPIETDEDRAKTLTNINSMLEKADTVYERLVDHRHQLDMLLSMVSSGSGTTPTSQPSVPSSGHKYHKGFMLSADHGSQSPMEGMVNRSIQEVALCYSRSCKMTYRELSNLIRSVVASRKEVAEYDQKKMEVARQEGIPVSPAPMPSVNWIGPKSSEKSRAAQKSCYGCASSAVGHCITLLKALAFSSETRLTLVEEGLITELVEHNQRSSNWSTQTNVQDLLCLLTKNNPEATGELNQCILSRIMSVVENHHLSPNIATAVQPEINLLIATLSVRDKCWEQRLRTVVRLFQNTRRHRNPTVVEAVALPCLAVLKRLAQSSPEVKQSQEMAEKSQEVSKTGEAPPVPSSTKCTVDAMKWLEGQESMSFKAWVERKKKEQDNVAAMSTDELRAHKLQEKYVKLWRSRIRKFAAAKAKLHHASWLRSMLFNPSSRAARLAACKVVESLCKGNEPRRREILDMLCSYLPDVSEAGEKAAEFLHLFMSLTGDVGWKLYLSTKGILHTIGELLSKEIQGLGQLEKSTLSADVAQGYALHMLAQLLKSFLSVPSIKQQYKSKLVGMVLNSFLGLRCLVVQRTKRIDDAESLLLKILEDLTSGTEEETKKFMAECVASLKTFSTSDLVTPLFVFERLNNMILPEKSDDVSFYLQLDKDPQQEEFLQGRMQGNPYKSSDPGLGPLMRDIKNKICTDCELVALLEDDSGMELLVCNKIISLDLPVKEVYKKVWLAQSTTPQSSHCMRVVFRMRGLMGDATEEFIETLSTGSSKSVDEEELYHMAEDMSKCDGLDAALTRLAHIQDLSRGHQLIAAILKFLSYCLKLKVNRQYAIQPQLNTLNILLGVLNKALCYEQDHSGGVGASIAEKVLSVMENVLLEASSSQNVIIRQTSSEQTTAVPVEGERSQLSQLLSHIETPFVQMNPAIRKALMQVLPYLTFGVADSMHTLLNYFKPYLNFDKFDSEHSSEVTLYLDCFTAVASGIGADVSGSKLKDLMIEQGLVKLCVDYIHDKVPFSTSLSVSMNFESPAWRECLVRPSLSYVLQILTGLCSNHHRTQRLLMEVLSQLHLLEQVSSTEYIGSLTESLLKVLDEEEVVKKVEEEREATKDKKSRRAMAMREKMLKEFGMQLNEKGQVTAQSKVMKDLEETVKIKEEKGLTCCICREGYQNEPKKLLGVYTFTKRINVEDFEKKSRKTQGFSTVTHFNVIHFDCHTAAVMTARGRNEWESAMLQNSNTRCNGVLPIWGPEVSDSAFASCLARHNSYVREATSHYDASYSTWIHDLKHLLLKFANEKSFSTESGGGGPQSNMYFAPYLLHVALYVLNTTRLYPSEEKSLTAFVKAPTDSWVASAYELEGPHYYLVTSLTVYTLEQWKANKLALLKRLLVVAHTRQLNAADMTNLPADTAVMEYSVYKPALVFFGLIDYFQKTFKKKLDVAPERLPEALLDFIRQNTSTLISLCDKILSAYQDELLTAESVEEMFDVLELLGEVPNPDEFLSALMDSVKAN